MPSMPSMHPMQQPPMQQPPMQQPSMQPQQPAQQPGQIPGKGPGNMPSMGMYMPYSIDPRMIMGYQQYMQQQQKKN